MSSRARWWLALVATAIVVIAIGVLVIRKVADVPADRHSSSPPSTPTVQAPAPTAANSPASSPVSGLRLDGAGDTTIVLQTATAIYQLNLTTGAVVSTPTPELVQFSSFVAGKGWVIFKTIDNTPGVVVDANGESHPLPTGLRANGRLYLTSHNDLWLVPEDATDGVRTATRHGIDGRRIGTETITLPNDLGAESDLAGNLATTTATGTYQADPGGIRRISTGPLIGLNARQALSWDCDRHARCDPYLVDRATAHRTRRSDLRTAVQSIYSADSVDSASDYTGMLSPDGQHVAVAASGDRPDQPFPLVLVDLTTAKVTTLPGSITDQNPNAQFVWTLNSRYLLAITDGRLQALDTRTGRITSYDPVPGQRLLHLIVAGQPTN